MDETLVGDMHTLLRLPRDRRFAIIPSPIKHESKGQTVQSDVELSWQREEE